MKKYLFYIILSCLIATSASARKTGCEGDCENGFGKWTYTDKTTYEGNWVDTKKNPSRHDIGRDYNLLAFILYLVQAFQTDSLSANHFLPASSWVNPSRSTKAAIAPICPVENDNFLNAAAAAG